ncbi:MAG: ATP-binding cassette domain-containing protein [Planctomycetota bacterium]
MTSSHDPQSNTMKAKQAARMLEFFADKSKLSFDRPLAIRTVAEMMRTIPGDDYRTWGQRLVEAGASLNLRIRSTDLTLDDVIKMAREGIPVAACFAEDNLASDSPVNWIALEAYRRGRVQVVNFADDTSVWMGKRQLRHLLRGFADRKELRWITGQPALPCEVQTQRTPGVTSGPIRPFERLLGMIRPDRSDMWAIVTFSVVVGILALAVPLAVEALVNTVAFGRYLQPIIVLSFILMIFLGFAAAIRALLTLVVEILQRRLFVRVVEDLAYRLPRVKQEAMDGHYGPELVNRFFDVISVQKVAAKLLLDGIAVLLTTFLGMAVLAFYHPLLLGFDVALLACIGFIVFVLGRNAVKTAIAESATKYRVAAWLEELVRNPTAFKFHGGAQFGLDRADQLTVDYLQARRTHFRIVMRQIIFALTLQAVAATVLLGLGGWLVIQGQLTLGQLVAAELIVMNIVASFAKIGKYVESFYDLLASVDKLGKLFDLPIESHNKLFHLQDTLAASLSVNELSQTLGSKRLHGGLSFEVAPQERLAVMGPAGSGKSALLDLITGARQPSSGNLSLDGIDLRELRPDSLREHVALARDVDIFRGTIEENVHLNRPQINASDVREALERVGLLNELMALKDGLGTQVDTGGYPLSSSQARRLMLARAIVGRPRLLLVDGTLDGMSDRELEILSARLLDGNAPWTLVLTTGRKDLAARCDRVLELETQGPGMPSASLSSH